MEASPELAAWWQASQHLFDQFDAGATSQLVPARPCATVRPAGAGTIHPRVTKRISFDEVADAHRRLEAGSLDGRLVLCPDLPLAFCARISRSRDRDDASVR